MISSDDNLPINFIEDLKNISPILSNLQTGDIHPLFDFGRIKETVNLFSDIDDIVANNLQNIPGIVTPKKITNTSIFQFLNYHLAKLDCDLSKVNIDDIVTVEQLFQFLAENKDLIFNNLEEVLNNQLELIEVEQKYFLAVGEIYTSPPSIKFTNLNVFYDSSIDIALRWQQYQLVLDNELQMCKYRTEQHYEMHDRMPEQYFIYQLIEVCQSLTKEYHGQSNINLFYQYFMQMYTACNICAYDYDDIQLFTSEDNYLSTVDVKRRRELLDIAEQGVRADYLKSGGMFARGRTAIDNVTLANSMPLSELNFMQAFSFAKRLIVEKISNHQNTMLDESSSNIESYEINNSFDELCFSLLITYKKPIENFGQLPLRMKTKIKSEILDLIPRETQHILFTDFVDFVNNNPGEYFTHPLLSSIVHKHGLNPFQTHTLVMLTGIFTSQLGILPRSDVNDLTPKRSCVIDWERKYPLYNTIDGWQQLSRQIGIRENLRLFVNEMPYRENHGMSMVSSGYVEDKFTDDLLYEFSIPIDVNSHIDNTQRDIEKMFREMKILNPQSSNLLTGEKLITLSQNASSYSSINETFHLHISTGSLEDYPLLCEVNAPFYIDSLQASFDIVSVGSANDAVILKVEFANLESEKLIETLIKMYTSACEYYKNSLFSLDSAMHLLAKKTGGYVFVLIPMQQCQAIGDKVFNPITRSYHDKLTQLIKVTNHPMQENFTDQRSLGREFIASSFDHAAISGIRQYLFEYFTNLDKF